MIDILDKIRSLLPRGRGMEAELYLVRSHLLHFEYKDKNLDVLREADEVGVGIRLFSEGRLGSASTTRIDPPALERMVIAAHTHLQLSDPIFPKGIGSLGKISEASNVSADASDSRTNGVARSSKIAAVRELEAAALDVDPRIRRVRGACYEERGLEIIAAPFGGGTQQARKQVMSLSLLAVAEDRGEAESSWDWTYAASFDRLNPKQLAQNAAQEALSKLGARPIPTQCCPVLLSNMMAGEILGQVSSAFLGDRQAKGLSPLKGRVGEKVYADCVTVIDDGRLAGGFASFPFDGEGVPTRETTVVDGGRLTGFLYDRVWGAMAGAGSTGNGVRSGVQDPPAPGVTNLFIRPGTQSVEELQKQMDRGFLVMELIGLHTANPITGDFSVGAAGHWIDKGERCQPVRGVALSGNFHDLLARVEAAGADLRFYGGTGSPSLLISKMDVGGS